MHVIGFNAMYKTVRFYLCLSVRNVSYKNTFRPSIYVNTNLCQQISFKTNQFIEGSVNRVACTISVLINQLTNHPSPFEHSAFHSTRSSHTYNPIMCEFDGWCVFAVFLRHGLDG